MILHHFAPRLTSLKTFTRSTHLRNVNRILKKVHFILSLFLNFVFDFFSFGVILDFAGLSYGMLGFLFFISVMAGLIDTMAGGGGLLTVPALMMSGIPPLSVLGTNKFQSTMGSGTATCMMLNKKKIKFADVKYKMLTAFIGATIGTILIQFVNTKTLSFVIPIILLIVLLYFIFAPKVEQATGAPKISDKRFQNAVVPAIGCYDGMFGPGTGSFLIMAGVSLRGQGIIHSSALAKSMNFATNVASLIVFLLVGKVFWLVGLLMMVGQFIGARFGAHYLFRIDPKYLRLLIIVMSLGMLARYVVITFMK